MFSGVCSLCWPVSLGITTVCQGYVEVHAKPCCLPGIHSLKFSLFKKKSEQDLRIFYYQIPLPLRFVLKTWGWGAALAIKHLLLFQRAPAWFPVPIPGGPQPYTSLGPYGPVPLVSVGVPFTCSYPCPLTHIHSLKITIKT